MEEQSLDLFLKLASPLHALDLWGLLQCGWKSPDVYVYNSSTKSVHKPLPGHLDWDIEFILAKHNRKHVFCNRSTPGLPAIGKAVAEWISKVHWKYVFRDRDRGPWSHLRMKSRTPFCPEVVSSDLHDFTARIGHEVFSWAKWVKSRARRHRTSFANFSPLHAMAINTLKKGRWGIVPTDKDGGWCLVDKYVLADEQFAIMSKPWYMEVPRAPMLIEDVMCEFAAACKDAIHTLMWDEDESKSLLRALLAPCKGTAPKLICTLKSTIKTHKPPGMVAFRPIHAAGGSPFTSAMKMCKHLLTEGLGRQRHLLKDSMEVKSLVAGLRVPSSADFCKIDVKDFYLSGSSTQVIQDSSMVVAPEFREFYRILAKFILDNQYIEIKSEEDRLWRVVRGAGMGMLFAGEISDAALYHKLERFILASDVQEARGIHLYARYRDDMLLLVSATAESKQQLLRIMQERADYYKLELESDSAAGAVFLDTYVHKGQSWRLHGTLDVSSHRKPTSIQQPLACSSAHPPQVHDMWPVAACTRLQNLCNYRAGAEKAISVLRNLLDAKHGPGYFDTLHDVARERPPKRTVSTHSHLLIKDSWLVLPWHPAWSLANMNKALRSCCETYGALLQRIFGHALNVRVSWSLGAPHILHRLYKLNEQIHDNADAYRIFNRHNGV